MLHSIFRNVLRQKKGLDLLLHLMQEEFSLLLGRKPQDITKLEFSIQELLGQLVAERKSLQAMLHGMRLREYLEALPPQEDTQLESLRQAIVQLVGQCDVAEQACAKQAEKNSSLVLALMDQGQKLLQHLHDQLVPKNTNAYSKRGRFSSESKPRATLISGRL